MKRAIPLGVVAILLAGPAMAKDTRFWNLTSSTVKSLELAPAGTSAFGPNQTTNDPDGDGRSRRAAERSRAWRLALTTRG